MTIHNRHHGFTLMEILVVSTILIVLGLALLISINPLSQILKGYDAKRRSDLDKIKIAFEAYYSDYDCYPPTSVLNNCGSAALQPYLTSIPCDPNSKAPYKIKILPENSSCPQQYAVYASVNSIFSTNTVPGCTDTFAVYSTNMSGFELTKGCGTTAMSCTIVYGCVNGSCSVIAVDQPVICSTGNSSCDTDCGTNCAATRPNGTFANECNPIYQ